MIHNLFINKKSSYKIKWMHLWNFLFLSLYIINLLDFSLIPHIKIIYQLIGFLYLVFLPGFLFLKTVSKEEMDSSYMMILSVVASIFILMLLGFLANYILPSIGIEQPLSKNVLFLMIFIFCILLTMLYYSKKNKNNIYVTDYISDKALLLAIFIPIIPLIGTKYQDYYFQDNLFNVVMVAYIALYTLLYSIDIIKNSNNEHLIIFFISLGLLYQYSLISHYIFGYDTHFEYFTTNQVLNNAVWNPAAFAFGTNQMLSSTVYPVYFVKLLDISLTYFLKFVYPVLFSFVPFAVYLLYRNLTNKKFAFLSVLFFMFQPFFFSQMIMNFKQGIAEIFFATFFLLIFYKKIDETTKTVYMILCFFSVVVSHYGISYFLGGYLILYTTATYIINSYSSKHTHFLLKNTKTIIYFVLLASWGIHLALSSTNGLIHLFVKIYDSINADFFSLDNRHPSVLSELGMNPDEFDFLRKVNANVIRFTHFTILIGAAKMCYDYYKKRDILIDTIIFTSISIIILLMCIFLPYFSQVMQVGRIYHVTLFVLVLSFSYGFSTLIHELLKILNFSVKRTYSNTTLYSTIALFLTIFLLLQTGLIHYFSDQQSPVAISPQSHDPAALNLAYTHTSEVHSAGWLSNHKSSYRVYADPIAKQHVLTSYGNLLYNQNFIANNTKTGYTYLRFVNTEYGDIPSIVNYKVVSLNLQDTDISSSNKIYSNNLSHVYFKSE